MLFVGSHFTLFIILFIISHVIYYKFFRHVTPTVASGSIIMALTVFALQCLPELPFSNSWLLILALWLFIVWVYITVELMQVYLSENIIRAHMSDRLGIGYWISGTSLMALLMDQAEHTLHGYIVFLSMIAFLLYLIYLIIIVKWLIFTLRHKFNTYLNGVVMLPAISTQAVALLLIELFGKSIPDLGYQIVIFAGVIMFIVGLISILHYTLHAHLRRWIASGSNANCLIYAALSMIGLAGMNAGIFSSTMCMAVWWCAISFFFIIETFELARLLIRVKIKGIKKGIFVYNTSQWFRIFAFGILYGFTLSYYVKGYPVAELMSVIVAYVQYIVVALLAFQLIMVMSCALKREIK